MARTRDQDRTTADVSPTQPVRAAGRTNRAAKRYAGVATAPSTAAKPPARALQYRLMPDVQLDSPANAAALCGAEPTAVTDIHTAAATGIAGPAARLPHARTIQSSFGRHDISGITAHVGGPATDACDAMSANAYATGNDVAFAAEPDLHTAAHEAAHVIQQRAGVHLSGGVGQAGDSYEQHADRVADLVVAGESAEAELGAVADVSSGADTVQRDSKYTENDSIQRREDPARRLSVDESAQVSKLALKLAAAAARNTYLNVEGLNQGENALVREAEILDQGSQTVSEHLMQTGYPGVESFSAVDEAYSWSVRLLLRLKEAGWDTTDGYVALAGALARLGERMSSLGWAAPTSVADVAAKSGNPNASAEEAQTMLHLKIIQVRGRIAMYQQMIRNRLRPGRARYGSGERVEYRDGVGETTQRQIEKATASSAEDMAYLAGLAERSQVVPRDDVLTDVEAASNSIVSLLRWAQYDAVDSGANESLLRDLNRLRDAVGMAHVAVEQWSPVANDEEHLEDVLNDIAGKYKWLCWKQRDQVESLRLLSEKSDPPPVAETLLKGLAEVGIAAALGGIGSLLSGAVMAAVKSDAGVKTVSMLADAMSDAAKEFASQTFGVVFESHRDTGDSRELFFASQRDLLTELGEDQEQQFDLVGKFEIRRAANPLGEATALLAALDQESEEAGLVQRRKTFDQWCVYLAQNELGLEIGEMRGGRKRGANLDNKPTSYGTKNRRGDGTLELVVDATGDGKPTILQAKIAGLNEPLRQELLHRSIRDIQVPLVVTGEVGVDRSLREGLQQKIWIGHNTSGTVWLRDEGQYGAGWEWLNERAGGTGSSKDGAVAGARILLEEDIGPLSIPESVLEG